MNAPFQLTMQDERGNDVTLEVMPRTHFDAIGPQTGIRLAGPIATNTIGLVDDELDRLILALQAEKARKC